MRHALPLALLLLVLLVCSAACRTFSVPSEVCKPDSVNGKTNGGGPDVVCSACLEDKCCDDIGRCTDEPGCPERVAKTQACVVAAGLTAGAEERRCADDNLQGARTPTLTYKCMREQCGEACGLPVCQLDPTASLFVSPACDNCFTGSCCDAINACYRNRTCKLMLECVTTTCKTSLGATLAAIDPNLANGAATAACAGSESSLGPSCVQTCVDEFARFEQGLLLDSAQTARCLATNVLACGVRAGCGAKCTSP